MCELLVVLTFIAGLLIGAAAATGFILMTMEL